MTGRKTKAVGLFDVPVEFPCPYCGKGIKVEAARFQVGRLDVVCRPCRREIQLNEEQTSDILGKHTRMLDALRRRYGGG